MNQSLKELSEIKDEGELILAYCKAMMLALEQVHPDSYDTLVENLVKELKEKNHLKLLPKIEEELAVLLQELQEVRIEENKEFIHKLNNFVKNPKFGFKDVKEGIVLSYEENDEKKK